MPSSGCNQPPYCFYWIFRWHKCYASCSNIIYVLVPYSVYCIYYQLVASRCSYDDNMYWVLDLGRLSLNSPLLPLGLSYVTTLGICWLFTESFKVPVEMSMEWVGLETFYRLVFSAGWFLKFWAAVLHVKYAALLDYLLFVEYLAFLASYSCINLVNLLLPYLMHLQKPTIATLHVDSSSTNLHPLFCLLRESLSTRSFVIFQSIFSISFLNQITILKL
jgi:hypothetical protein